MWPSSALVRILFLALVCFVAVGCSETPTDPADNNDPQDPGLMVANVANLITDVMPEANGWPADRDGGDTSNPDYEFFFDVDHGAIEGVFGESDQSVNSVLGELAMLIDSYNLAAFTGEGSFSFPHPDLGMITVTVTVETAQVTVDVPVSCRGALGLTAVDVDYIINLSAPGIVDDLQVGLQHDGDVETLLMYVSQPESSGRPGATLIYTHANTATGSAEIRSVSVMSSSEFFASNAFIAETTGADHGGFHYNSSSVGYPVAIPPEVDGHISINASGDRDVRFGLLYAIYAYPDGPLMVEGHEVLLGPDYADLSEDGVIPAEHQGLTNTDELILYDDLPEAVFASPFSR